MTTEQEKTEIKVEPLDAPAIEPVDNEGLKTLPPVPKIKLTMEEKEQFFKCFLSEKPYIETVSLFGGKYSIKLKTLTVEENNDILAQIVRDQDASIAKNNDTYFLRMVLYRLALSLVEDNEKPFEPDITKENVPIKDGSSYITKRIEPCFKWQVFKLAGIQDAFKAFEYKIINLTKEIEQPDFWKAAE